jgi:hypothetical protein
MKKLLIASLAFAALSVIPITYLLAARGGSSRAGDGHSFSGGHTSGASVRTAGASRTKSIASPGFTSKKIARTGSTRMSTTSSPSRLSTHSGTRVASGKVAGRERRRGEHGAFWSHRSNFRHFRGNFWELGVGYPWWWSTYPHICLDEFGFEYPTSFCYEQPNLYFWWYR